MDRRLALLTLAAALCAPALARASEGALADGFSGAAAAAASALKAQRALAAVPETVAADAAAPQVREFRLASNDSNSPDIYRTLVASGARKACESRVVDDGGFPRVHETCDAVGPLDRVTVFRNEIIWRSTQIVKVAGDVHCWTRWLSPGGVHHPPMSLWYFCDFRGTVESK